MGGYVFEGTLALVVSRENHKENHHFGSPPYKDTPKMVKH